MEIKKIMPPILLIVLIFFIAAMIFVFFLAPTGLKHTETRPDPARDSLQIGVVSPEIATEKLDEAAAAAAAETEAQNTQLREESLRQEQAIIDSAEPVEGELIIKTTPDTNIQDVLNKYPMILTYNKLDDTTFVLYFFEPTATVANILSQDSKIKEVVKITAPARNDVIQREPGSRVPDSEMSPGLIAPPVIETPNPGDASVSPPTGSQEP